MSKSLPDRLKTLLGDHRHFHSELQLDRFVIGAAGHPWHQYQQALRELETRWEALKLEEIEMEEARLDIDEAEEDKRGQLQKARAIVKLEGMERRQKDRLREFAHIFGRAEALRDWVGELDDARRAELDKAAWLHRTKSRIALETIVHGCASIDTAESTFLFEVSDRVTLGNFLNRCRQEPESAIGWLEGATGTALPSATRIPEDSEVEALLCR